MATSSSRDVGTSFGGLLVRSICNNLAQEVARAASKYSSALKKVAAEQTVESPSVSSLDAGEPRHSCADQERFAENHQKAVLLSHQSLETLSTIKPFVIHSSDESEEDEVKPSVPVVNGSNEKSTPAPTIVVSPTPSPVPIASTTRIISQVSLPYSAAGVSLTRPPPHRAPMGSTNYLAPMTPIRVLSPVAHQATQTEPLRPESSLCVGRISPLVGATLSRERPKKRRKKKRCVTCR